VPDGHHSLVGRLLVEEEDRRRDGEAVEAELRQVRAGTPQAAVDGAAGASAAKQAAAMRQDDGGDSAVVETR